MGLVLGWQTAAEKAMTAWCVIAWRPWLVGEPQVRVAVTGPSWLLKDALLCAKAGSCVSQLLDAHGPRLRSEYASCIFTGRGDVS